jgi:hypothetical protein
MAPTSPTAMSNSTVLHQKSSIARTVTGIDDPGDGITLG